MSEPKHARLGPSNHRWPHCPGSIREEEKYPDIPSEAAIDGTGSHLLLECCLTHGVRADAYEGQVIGVNHPDKSTGWLVSSDRIERVQMCLDYIQGRVEQLKTTHPTATVTVLTETRSDPGEHYGRDDWWGTVDVTIVVMNGDALLFIEVIDYKDGREFVSAEWNTQLISYMRGKLPKEPMMGQTICPVRMTIVQPKTTPVVRYFDTTSTMVRDEGDRLAQKAAATDDPNAPLVAGKHCRWCKHKPNCTAESEAAVGMIATIPLETTTVQSSGSLFELVSSTFGDITTLDNARLVELADARAGIEAVFDKVEAEIQRRIEAGQDVPGYAMRPGRGSNVWNAPDEEIAKMLKARRLSQSDIYPAKLISPAQVLKLEKLTDKQKKDIQEKFISYVGGDLKLTRVREKEKAEEVFASVVKQQAVTSFM